MQELGMKMKIKGHFLAIALAATAVFSPVGMNVLTAPAYAAAEVAIIVNNNAITNYDIQRRVAFLKLQHRKGNLNKIARDELTDDMLKRVEMARRAIVVSDAEVNQAYSGFASRNKMTKGQLDQVLNQAGVTPDHFKTFIRTQIGWSRLVGARYRSSNEGGMISEQEAVQRILRNGGIKPTAREYRLQQVIFVVPSNRRNTVGARTAQANKFRASFQGCDNLRKQAKDQMDVTVRNLGRILEQQLPQEWSKSVLATSAGQLTAPKTTERGVEMLAVCEIRKVSDDRVARLVYSIQDNEKGADSKADELSEKYLKELRAAARIQNP